MLGECSPIEVTFMESSQLPNSLCRLDRYVIRPALLNFIMIEGFMMSRQRLSNYGSGPKTWVGTVLSLGREPFCDPHCLHLLNLCEAGVSTLRCAVSVQNNPKLALVS